MAEIWYGVVITLLIETVVLIIATAILRRKTREELSSDSYYDTDTYFDY